MNHKKTDGTPDRFRNNETNRAASGKPKYNLGSPERILIIQRLIRIRRYRDTC